MNIFVSLNSKESLYEQVENQVKKQILSGALKAGDIMPSVRVLAKELQIGIITAKRAYDDLVRDGFLMSKAGKGYYVNEVDTDAKKTDYIQKIEKHAEEIAALAVESGIGKKEICEIIERRLQKSERN